MKKNRLISVSLVSLLVVALTICMTGCKKFVLSNDFTDSFGKKEYYDVDAGNLIKPITTNDTPLAAWKKMEENFKQNSSLAYRGIVNGTISGNMTQTVYSTYIRQKDTLTGNLKFYKEDGSLSSSNFGNSVVKTFGVVNVKEATQNYLIKYAEKDVAGDNNGYPNSDESNYVYEEYKDQETYLANYYENLDKLSIYNINGETLVVDKCSIEEDKYGFIDVKFVFKDKSFDIPKQGVKEGKYFLQDATSTRREVIAKKAKYGGMVTECNANDVTFNQLTLTFKLWKSGNIRSLIVNEDYTMKANTLIGKLNQDCKFTSNFYYSNDPEELPIAEFEFKKP